MLLEFLRHINNPEWGGVIFRRTTTQIRNEGGLWDTSMRLYPHVKAEPKESYLEWHFPKGPKLKFSHIEHDKNMLDWQGAQIPYLGFDELTHFSERVFWYLLSRNRSTCGIKPYVRCTCNPDPDSWVAKLIEWWIDQDTGFPIQERSGVIRYFTRDGENYIWGDTKAEVIEKAWYFLKDIIGDSGIDPEEFVKSITFVAGSVYQNKELLKVNPGYLANLTAQDEQTKSQLLKGNWKVVMSENDIYDYSAFLGMFDNVKKAEGKGKFITSDIALKGSDKFITGYWEGYELLDLLIMDKSRGNDVVDGIANMARYHGVQNRHITFDNDGLGGFVDGFIKGAIPFNNGGSPMKVKDAQGKSVPENYEHLKAQCYYRSGDNVSKGLYKVNEHVATMMYNDKETVRQRFIKERKAIKRDKPDSDKKLKIIPKAQMKVILGSSPDLMDMFMMREIFDLVPKNSWTVV